MAGGVAGFYKNKCFAAGEHVWTENGSQPIETLRVGDLVLSRDEFDVEGELVAKRIEEVFVQSGEVFRLRVCGVSIGTTAEHPFYSLSRGWTAAGELEVGEFIATASGEWVPVEALEQTTEQATLYNFLIADFHTYFVGKRVDGVGVWAHNSYGDDALVRPSQGALNNTHGEVFENVANARLSRTSRTPFFKSTRRGGFDDVTLEGGRVVINEEKFVRRLQFDDFTSITTNLRANVQEVLRALKGNTMLSRAEKSLVRRTLNDFSDGNVPDNLSIRILYGKAAPGSRLLKRIENAAGLPVEAIAIRGLE